MIQCQGQDKKAYVSKCYENTALKISFGFILKSNNIRLYELTTNSHFMRPSLKSETMANRVRKCSFKVDSLFPIITNRFSLQYSRLSIEHHIRCRLSVVYASLVLSTTIADNLCVNISSCNYSSVESRILGYAFLVFQKRCLQQ